MEERFASAHGFSRAVPLAPVPHVCAKHFGADVGDSPAGANDQ